MVQFLLSFFLFLSLLASIDVSAAAACGVVDSTFGVYSTASITVGSGVKMNGSTVSSGTTPGDVGIATDGSITTASITIPGLDPASFPANSVSTDADETDSPISSSVEIYFDEVRVGVNQTLRFTGEGPFHINTLTLEDESNVYFSSGTYYIDRIIFREHPHIRLSDAPVALHIGTDMDMGDKRIHINQHDGGKPEDLTIYLHRSATLSGAGSNDDSQIKAIIIGVDNGTIEFGTKLLFDGVILSENDIVIGANASFDLNADTQTAINNVSTCVSGGGSGGSSNVCSAIFAAGMQMSSASGTIEFESGGQLQGNPSLELVTPSIN